MDAHHRRIGRNEVLEVGGVSYIDDRDKANQFGKTYRGYSKLPTRKTDRALRKKLWSHMKTESEGLQEGEEDISEE